jgi:hypothetical protein
MNSFHEQLQNWPIKLEQEKTASGVFVVDPSGENSISAGRPRQKQ